MSVTRVQQGDIALAPRRALIMLLLAIGVLAVGVRLYYVVHAQMFQPLDRDEVRGDAADYYRYAWNILHHGTFSMDLPDMSTAPRPDSFRDPGYPAVMAAVMASTADYDQWYIAMLLGQAVIGGLTVVLLLAAARGFLGTPWLVAAGVVAALWPHSVAMPGYLLSETSFGFFCALALWSGSILVRAPGITPVVISALFFSLAAMTNLVLLPFVIFAGIIFGLYRRLAWRHVLLFIVASLALPTAWAVRSAVVAEGPTSSGRAALNLVQGSWPSLYDDYRTATGRARDSEPGKRALAAMDVEARVLSSSPREGISMVLRRMSERPWHYVGWYLSKPVRLWAWDIQIGQGSIYVYPTRHSPFEENPWWEAILVFARASNGCLLLLATAGCVYALRKRAPDSALFFALICLFITVVYSTFQAEPRYSVALRGPEIFVAMYGLATMIRTIQVWRQSSTRATRA